MTAISRSISALDGRLLVHPEESLQGRLDHKPAHFLGAVAASLIRKDKAEGGTGGYNGVSRLPLMARACGGVRRQA
jgi:hypothetical protein